MGSRISKQDPCHAPRARANREVSKSLLSAVRFRKHRGELILVVLPHFDPHVIFRVPRDDGHDLALAKATAYGLYRRHPLLRRSPRDVKTRLPSADARTWM
jgi:hypothetical protein